MLKKHPTNTEFNMFKDFFFTTNITFKNTDPLTYTFFSLFQIGGLTPPAARECWEKTRGEEGLGQAKQTSGESVLRAD